MLLTARQAAERLSVSPRTIYLWIQQGRLPAVRMSERVTRIPSEAVDVLAGEAGVTPGTAGVVAEAQGAYTTSRAGTDAAEVLRRLLTHRTEIIAIAECNRARNVRVFGSVARKETTEVGDVDFLVDLQPGASLFDLGGLNYELEQLLGVPVDVVPAHTVRERIRERVLAEAIPL